MAIGFDLSFRVGNPNRLPLPLSEVLTALTVFPDRSNQSLGAVCLRMCEPGDTRCQGGADSNACREAPGDIKSVRDFPNAIGQMLVAVKEYPEALETLKKIPEPEFKDWKTTSPELAPINGATRSPRSATIVHQVSSQARTPRVAQV